MLLAGDALGMVPLGHDIATDFSVLSNYEALNADPFQVAVYRVEADVYDPATASIVRLQWAQDRAELKIPGEPYPDRVLEAVNVTTSILGGEISAIRGAAPSFGSIRVQVRPNEGDDDEFEQYRWGNRAVRVYRGFKTLPADEWKLVQDARCVGIRVRETEFSIDLQDPSLDLQKSIQSDLYAGTGEIEGGEDLTDQPRPICIGVRQNITPHTIDRVFLVYQFHDRSSQSVDAVRDKGIELAAYNGGLNDITDLALASIWDWAPTPADAGTYITDLSQSLVRLASQPAGLVTLSVHGDNTGGVFAQSHPEIADKIVRLWGGLTDAQIDASSIYQMGIANTGVAGIYITNGSASVLSVLAELLKDILGFWTFALLSKFSLGQVRSAPPVRTIREHQVFQFSSETSPKPHHKLRIQYAESNTVQNADSLAGGVDPAWADFVGEQYRVREYSAPVLTEFADAVERDLQTHFEDGFDSEGNRQMALLSSGARIWNFSAEGHGFRIRVGDSVRVVFNRYGFEMGRNGIVLSVTESSTNPLTKLVIWG